MLIDQQEFEFLSDSLKACGTLEIDVTGASMIPVLQDGECVEIEPVRLDEIRRFDILVFLDQHSLVCHYVWKIQPEGLICRSYQFGDADLIPAQAILGRVRDHRLTPWQRILARIF